MTGADAVDQLRQALGAVEDVVAGIGADQWAAPTPCTDWNVRQLLNHLVGGNQLVAAVVSGQGVLPPDRAPARTPDHLGDDPLDQYRRSAAAVLDAFALPGRLEAPVDMPVGTVPGPVAVQLRVTETLVHGWDVARATGQSLAVPGDLAGRALDFTLAMLPSVPAGRSPFGPPQPVPDGAPAIDRLAATLGRHLGGKR